MVSGGRLGVSKFVELTATAPARIYNLARKGSIAVGKDADIAIWDPQARVTFSDETVRDATGYTAYPGRTVRGWPTTVLVRGGVAVEDGTIRVSPGHGRFIPRDGGEAATPIGRLSIDMDPAHIFGARLL
jgi:dihydropyrimidinase